ncbi:MAG: cytochrome c biogenesis protein ResB, partial [Nitrospirae bacterium]
MSFFRIINSIWNLFSSVKLAIFLFLAIAISSIIGTVVEQNVEPAKNMALFIKLFGNALGPTLFHISYKLGFMDMYHSHWFRILLFLFSANIVICSIERLPHIWKIVKKPLSPLKEKAFTTIADRYEVNLKGDMKSVKIAVQQVLAKERFKPMEDSSQDGSIQLYGEKGKYALLGVYVVHFSIIVIFIGALIGSFFGFKGYLNLPEGGSSSFYYNSGKPHP